MHDNCRACISYQGCTVLLLCFVNCYIKMLGVGLEEMSAVL